MSRAFDPSDEKAVGELREYVKRRVAETSLRQVGTASGVAHATVSAFIDGDGESTERTLRKLAKWREAGGHTERDADTSYRTNGYGRSELSRQIDEILHSDADDLTKTGWMIDLWGIYRQRAIADVGELLRGDREVLKLRAQAVADLARTTRLETEEAARRRADVSLAQKAERQAATVRRRQKRGEPEAPASETTTPVDASGGHGKD